MGIFYLANKHKWFRHRAEKAHQNQLAAGGSLVAAADKVDTLRFYCKDESTPPKNIRISDHGQATVAVIGQNGLIGHLDEASSQVMRRFLAENPDLQDYCPAFIVATEEWSGGYIIRIGLDEGHEAR